MADAKQKRNEQLQRWLGSETDLEPPVLKKKKTKVKFDDGAVFLAACSSGDTEEVLRLLDRGADINYANVDGLTALHQVGVPPSLHVTAVIFFKRVCCYCCCCCWWHSLALFKRRRNKRILSLLTTACPGTPVKWKPFSLCCLPTWPRQPDPFNPPSRRRADELCWRLPEVVLRGHS